MKYHSLTNPNHKVSFKEAFLAGIAPDKGLYFPETIPLLSADFLDNIHLLSDHEIAFEVLVPFLGSNVAENDLRKMIEATLTFEFPVVQLKEECFALELFHGPTFAFKDLGARFMAACYRYFYSDSNTRKTTILVATSGDTGGAVADSFKGMAGVNVVILFPSGKVSEIQELQLTTMGENTFALEIDGTFDDCQAFVKTAFLDDDLRFLGLTSANSINIARWLPQMIYYFSCYKQLKLAGKERFIVSVPSGNFGNVSAGLLAKKMGLPIDLFVAATNSNDTIPRFLQSGKYDPESTIETISNAMDVSDPSNSSRMLALYNQDLELLKNDLVAYSFSDASTREAIQELYIEFGYQADPHGAVAYLGLKRALEHQPTAVGCFIETAHPIKFKHYLSNEVSYPSFIVDQINGMSSRKQRSFNCRSYDDVKQFLVSL